MSRLSIEITPDFYATAISHMERIHTGVAHRDSSTISKEGASDV